MVEECGVNFYINQDKNSHTDKKSSSSKGVAISSKGVLTKD